jgi:hypothetical protein
MRKRRARRFGFSRTIAFVFAGILMGAVAVYAVHELNPEVAPSLGPLIPDQASVNSNVNKNCLAVTTCTTAGIAVAAYSSLLIFVGADSSTAPSGESDSVGGHTYTLKAHLADSTTSEEYVYITDNVSSGASVTATVTFASGTSYIISFVDVKLDYTVGTDAVGACADANSTSESNSVTTVTADDFVLLGMDAWKNTSFTASGGDAILESSKLSSFVSVAQADEVDTGTGSFTISATITKSIHVACAIAIKPAGVPGAPTSLAAGTVTTTTVPLTWVRSKGPVLNVTVFRATWAGGSCGAYSTGYSAGAVTAYTVTGLTEGAVYCFEAASWNSTGQGTLSAAVTAVQTANVPSAPSGLTVSPVPETTNSLLLSWSNWAGTLANVTLVYASGGCPLSGTRTYVDLGVDTSDTIDSLAAGTAYGVEAQDWNATGEGAWTSCVSGTTYSLPGAPTSLGVTSTTLTSVSLTWTNPSGSYVTTNDSVFYSSNGCASWLGAVSTAGAASSATVGSLSPYTKYCFAVTAWTAGGQGPLSGELNDTTLAAAPGAPTNLTVTATTTSGFSLSWTQGAVSSGTLLNDTVFVSDAGGACDSPWLEGLTTSGAFTAFSVGSLPAGDTYCVQVAAWTQGGQGPLSASVSVTLLNNPPGAPTSLTLVSASRTTLSFSWTNPSPTNVIVNLTAYYKAGASCAGALTAISVGVATTVEIGSLTAATQYSTLVRAWSNGGQGTASSCLTESTQGAAPPAPTTLTAYQVGATYVALVWDNPTGYTLYNSTIYLTAAGGSCGTWASKLSAGGVVTAYNATGLTKGSTYCIEVSAWDDESPLSDPLTVKTEGITVTNQTGNVSGPPPPTSGGTGPDSPSCLAFSSCWFANDVPWPEWFGVALLLAGAAIAIIPKRYVIGGALATVGGVLFALSAFKVV